MDPARFTKFRGDLIYFFGSGDKLTHFASRKRLERNGLKKILNL
jgi:hypothetical protein